jgi:hypothetical protein
VACEAYFAKSEAKIFDSETKLAFEQQRISKRPVLAILALKTDPCFARRAQAISPQSLESPIFQSALRLPNGFRTRTRSAPISKAQTSPYERRIFRATSKYTNSGITKLLTFGAKLAMSKGERVPGTALATPDSKAYPASTMA